MKAYPCLLIALILTVGIMGCKNTKNTTKQAALGAETTKIEKPGEATSKITPENANSKKTSQEIDPLTLNQNRRTLTTENSFALPSVIIYKTKADYSKNVPVGLNDEKTEIVSYPGKTDIKDQMPIPLEYGFLLDKRGINKNSAFLKYSYEEYIKLPEIPSIKALYNDIIDKDPFTEIYYCGKSSNYLNGDIVEQLNDQLKKCDGKPDEIFKKLK